MQMRAQASRVSPAGCLVPSVQHFQRIERHRGCPPPPSASIPPTKGPGGISRGCPLQTDSPGKDKENMQTAHSISVCRFNLGFTGSMKSRNTLQTMCFQTWMRAICTKMLKSWNRKKKAALSRSLLRPGWQIPCRKKCWVADRSQTARDGSLHLSSPSPPTPAAASPRNPHHSDKMTDTHHYFTVYRK